MKRVQQQRAKQHEHARARVWQLRGGAHGHLGLTVFTRRRSGPNDQFKQMIKQSATMLVFPFLCLCSLGMCGIAPQRVG
jgi:hypothetical protein